MGDPFQLERFVEAQAHGYLAALAEIRAGRKRTHWMWFVFPQIAGLGHSAMAQHYAISGIDEARAYLAHEILDDRLRETSSALLALPTPDAEAVFGPIDAVKLRSSMTLFKHAAGETETLFRTVLERWFDGVEDPATTARL